MRSELLIQLDKSEKETVHPVDFTHNYENVDFEALFPAQYITNYCVSNTAQTRVSTERH